MSTKTTLSIGALLMGLTCTAAAAVTPAQTCRQGKNNEAAKYVACRQNAEARFALTGDAAVRAAALQKCLTKYAGKWPTLEQRAAAAGEPCPSVGDQTAIQDAIDAHTTNVATALAGGELWTCPADLATCESVPQAQPLRTYATKCYSQYGVAVPCAGTGQDAELQKGLSRLYYDNADGTTIDARTGLTWEHLSKDGSIHDDGALYTWSQALAKIATLNATAFAGHTDWRLPNVRELTSLLYAGGIWPGFDRDCQAGCTVRTCSCPGLTAIPNPPPQYGYTFIDNGHWSSTSFVPSTYPAAYEVKLFWKFEVWPAHKTDRLHARAVRGG